MRLQAAAPVGSQATHCQVSQCKQRHGLSDIARTVLTDYQYIHNDAVNEFCDKSGMELQKGLKDIQRMLRDTKGILAVWKYQGLSEKERLEL